MSHIGTSINRSDGEHREENCILIENRITIPEHKEFLKPRLDLTLSQIELCFHNVRHCFGHQQQAKDDGFLMFLVLHKLQVHIIGS